MIEVNALHKRFQLDGGKALVAVETVSLRAPNGAVTGLLGPNGAGKSTTLRMLATLLKPDAGSAIIDGHDIAREPVAVRKCLGFMPHNAGIYPRLTTRENILYYARLCGMRWSDARHRVDELVEQLDMGEFADRRTAGFSQGQSTRVALARALVHRPETIMLDEPTNGLDVMSTRGLRKIIRSLADDGHCVLFSSHIMQEVEALCDRVAIINEGRIAAEGRVDELKARHDSANLEDAFVHIVHGEAAL